MLIFTLSVVLSLMTSVPSATEPLLPVQSPEKVSEKIEVSAGGEAALETESMEIDQSGRSQSDIPVLVAMPLYPTRFLDPNFVNVVSSFCVADLAPPLHSLVIARSTESVASVFKKVRAHCCRFQSARLTNLRLFHHS